MNNELSSAAEQKADEKGRNQEANFFKREFQKLARKVEARLDELAQEAEPDFEYEQEAGKALKIAETEIAKLESRTAAPSYDELRRIKERFNEARMHSDESEP